MYNPLTLQIIISLFCDEIQLFKLCVIKFCGRKMKYTNILLINYFGKKKENFVFKDGIQEGDNFSNGKDLSHRIFHASELVLVGF